MDQHAGRITLRPSQLAMFDGSRGRDGIAVFIGQLGSAQTYYQIVNQLGKMSGTFVIAKMKMVELRGLLCSRQPIRYQRGLTFSQYRGYAHRSPPLQFVIHHQNIVCDWYFDWSSHLTPSLSCRD